MAVLQKYIDQGISVNTSYNPQFFEDEKIPMSTMIQHMLMFYKYGGKQLYYFNTYDGAGEIDIDKFAQSNIVVETEHVNGFSDEEACDSCTI
jgi:ribonucleoside-diphosphate reductase alpha chain